MDGELQVNVCWMGLRSQRPHALGEGVDCLMCEAKRREDATRSNVAVATGLQRPVVTREVSA